MPATEITRADIMDMAEYARIRHDKRREMAALRRCRRLAVGPFATFHFESYATMWFQIHEMLVIEKGGEAQIPDEIDAYNPLIPQGRELVATVMFGIDDPIRRKAELARLGGVEEHMFIEVAGRRIPGRPEADLDRTTADGKASSVQFVHFLFPNDAVASFREVEARVVVGIDHAAYGHMAKMPEHVRAALAEDFA